MTKITDVIRAFIRGIAKSKVSFFGAILTTLSFPILLLGVLLDAQGALKNPYFAFVIYLGLGPLFIIGLIMVFLGLFIFRGKEELGIFTQEYLKEQVSDPTRFKRIQKLVALGVFLTILNIFIISLVSYSGYHYTESVSFCGQLCHTVMEPEYIAYQNSPHSRVSCVECHIGEGATWFVKSKISGARQLFAVAFDTYSKPIETPVHGLRPARDTCENCHRPELFHGDKLYIKDKFKPDENNTHVRTVMILKVGSGGHRGMTAQGIHWHVANENKITYTHSDYQREKITEVVLNRADGTKVVYKAKDDKNKNPDKDKVHSGKGGTRVMDCIDCHNRPTHIFLPPEEALDHKFVTGEIPRELPFIKKIALEAVTKKYNTTEDAKKGIATHIREWYSKNYPELIKNNPFLLEKAINGAKSAYLENVFPKMKIDWNTYKNHIGHRDDLGCFRCHNDSLYSESGETISMDCEKCHTILAEEEPEPKILKIIKGQANLK